MKKTLLLTALTAFFFSTTSFGQAIPIVKSLPKIDFGIKVGANFEQLHGDSWKQAYKPGIVGGLFFGVRKNKFGVQIEALANTAQYDFNGASGAADKIKATYVDVPLLFQYKLFSFLWLQAGPQYGTLVSAKQDGDNVKSAFKSGAASAVIGAELKLPVKINIGIRYVLGLSDINNSGASIPGATDAWQRRTIQLHVGFRFF